MFRSDITLSAWINCKKAQQKQGVCKVKPQRAVHVRQHPALTILWLLLCVCIILMSGYALFKYQSWNVFAALSPFFLTCLYALLYFKKWELIFSSDKVIVSIFLRNRREYSYYHISEASEWYSYVEHGYVMRLLFSDGSHVQFSHICTNYRKAKHEIMRHRTVTNKGEL